MSQEVPHIHLQDYHEGDEVAKQHLIQTLGDGLCEFGFLTVGGHGVDPGLIQRSYELFQQFFALDEDVKKKYDCVPGNTRGYTPYGREQAKDSDRPDLKEFWHVGQELPTEHPYRVDYPDNVWPNEVPELKDVTLALYRSVERCATTILHALADYFELPHETFAQMAKYGDSILRAIHYPPISSSDKTHRVRAAAHEDINLITLLPQSQGAGLEILTRQGEWLAVNAPEGDLVVDTGDMISRVTNNVIPATTHRVLTPTEEESRSRYSMPFFTHPYANCPLDVMESFTSEANPAKFPPITAREFLQERLREIGL